jgi:hypothetical protein
MESIIDKAFFRFGQTTIHRFQIAHTFAWNDMNSRLTNTMDANKPESKFVVHQHFEHFDEVLLL